MTAADPCAGALQAHMVLPRWAMPLLLWRTCSRVTNTPKKYNIECASSVCGGVVVQVVRRRMLPGQDQARVPAVLMLERDLVNEVEAAGGWCTCLDGRALFDACPSL
jgi:hypothetical protein